MITIPAYRQVQPSALRELLAAVDGGVDEGNAATLVKADPEARLIAVDPKRLAFAAYSVLGYLRLTSSRAFIAFSVRP